VGGWALAAAMALGASDGTALLLGAATATGLRALALATGWTLPAWGDARR
jgi:uncharacterized membrane protein YeiH